MTSNDEMTPEEAVEAIEDIFERLVDGIRVAGIADTENATVNVSDLENVTRFGIWATVTLAGISSLAASLRGTPHHQVGAALERILAKEDPFEPDE